MNRRTLTPEDRALEQEIQRSTKVSSYLDNVYEAIVTGNPTAARTPVPNYSTNSRGGNLSHETGGLSMNMQGLFLSSAEALGEDGVQAAIQTAYPAREDGKSTFGGDSQTQAQPMSKSASQPRAGTMVTESQFRAIKKYPQIVEFLGTEQGSKIANKIAAEINSLIADQIDKNTKLVHDNAISCVAQKQYLHQFFQGEGWVCKVTASGPFRGDEAFFFKDDEDKSFILRRIGQRYIDVSSEFNIVHDFRTVDGEQNET